MANTRDRLNDPWLKLLIWSPSGWGKTTLAGSFPKPAYFFDFDNRMEVLAGLDIEYDTYRDKSDAMPVSYDAAYKKLIELQMKPPKTVVLDSLTLFLTACMNRAFAMSDAFMTTKRIHDLYSKVPAQPDYNGQQTIAMAFLRKLTALPCHVIVTAHEDTGTDIMTDVKFKKIDATGKMAGRVLGLFNEVWRMHLTTSATGGVNNTVFKIKTRPDNLYTARSAYRDVLTGECALDEYDTPDFNVFFPKILAFLEKKRTRDAAKAAQEIKDAIGTGLPAPPAVKTTTGLPVGSPTKAIATAVKK